MILRTLVENTARNGDFGCEHGLSLHLEAGGERILMDTGAGSLFAANAKKLGVELGAVTRLVLSHGHGDHGGGLGTFLAENTAAPVYLRRSALERHLSRRGPDTLADISLDPALRGNPRLVYTPEFLQIAPGLTVFSGVPARAPLPRSNGRLLMERDGRLLPDDFSHEQNLAVEADGCLLLLTGCAHRGVENILRRFYDLWGRMPDVVAGGFHLSSRWQEEQEPPESVARLARFLLDTGAVFHTGHCTGPEAYRQLKERMGARLHPLTAGGVLRLGQDRGDAG